MDETETETVEVEVDRRSNPREGRYLVIRLRHLMMAILVFLATFVITQVQIVGVSSDSRDAIDNDSKSRDYLLELANWTTDKVIFDGCQVLVRQNEGSRAWKVWLLDKLEEITPPGNDVATDFITEGREKLDELIPVLPASDCKNPGPRPTPPPGFDPTAVLPSEISDPTTTEGGS